VSVQLGHDIHGPVGADVLILSGSVGATIDMWQPNLTALASRFRVLRLDHPGHGSSPTLPGPYRIEDLAEHALSTLDELDIERFAWCGLSMGAMIGMVAAARYPERVSGLVLSCTSSSLTDTSVWHDRARRVGAAGTEALSAEIVDRWFTPAWAREHPAEIKRARKWVSTTSDDAYGWCCRAIANFDFTEQLPSIRARTLIIGGTQDKATPIEPDARTLVSRIPGAHLEILDAAHLATMEQPSAANRLLIHHLSA
jgi:3-oxoadipate enol-lactonase